MDVTLDDNKDSIVTNLTKNKWEDLDVVSPTVTSVDVNVMITVRTTHSKVNDDTDL